MLIMLKMVLIFTLLGTNIAQKVTVEHTFFGIPKNLTDNRDAFLSKVSSEAKARLTAQPCIKLIGELGVSGIGEGLPYELPVVAADIDDTLEDDICRDLTYFLVGTGVLEQ